MFVHKRLRHHLQPGLCQKVNVANEIELKLIAVHVLASFMHMMNTYDLPVFERSLDIYVPLHAASQTHLDILS